MSAPPNDGYGQPLDQAQEQPYDGAAHPAHQEGAAAGKKKKRGYAAQAFEVGTGANALAGAQATGGQPFVGAPIQGGAAPYGSYPQAEPQPVAGGPAAPGYQYPQAGYGGQQPVAASQPVYGGYQAPDQGYQAPGGQGPPAGVAGITQGMAGMQVGGQPQQPGQAARPAVLNQLYPTDLLTQPFNATELDLPPPPIILPQNVSKNMYFSDICSFQLTSASSPFAYRQA
jgi:protein transport protein SEC24